MDILMPQPPGLMHTDLYTVTPHTFMKPYFAHLESFPRWRPDYTTWNIQQAIAT